MPGKLISNFHLFGHSNHHLLHIFSYRRVSGSSCQLAHYPTAWNCPKVFDNYMLQMEIGVAETHFLHSTKIVFQIWVTHRLVIQWGNPILVFFLIQRWIVGPNKILKINLWTVLLKFRYLVDKVVFLS